MKASHELWKERLSGDLPSQLADEVDTFEQEISLRSQDKVDEKVFAETRLRRGVYGQRYDNGQRHDGNESRQLEYDADKHTKGPNTVWDAPGMPSGPSRAPFQSQFASLLFSSVLFPPRPHKK